MDLSKEEEADILHSLGRILEHVAKLGEIDTKGVPPCSYVLSEMLKNQVREDIAQDPMSRDVFLANAPDQIGGMIRIPPVLK